MDGTDTVNIRVSGPEFNMTLTNPVIKSQGMTLPDEFCGQMKVEIKSWSTASGYVPEVYAEAVGYPSPRKPLMTLTAYQDDPLWANRNHTLTLKTTSDADIGSFTFALFIGFVDYSTPAMTNYYTINLNIGACFVDYFDPPGNLTLTYDRGSDKKDVSYAFFQSPCSYDVTYEIFLVTNEGSYEAAPSFVSFSTTQGAFSIYTNETADLGEYTLVVNATLNYFY